jgi:hypothetical protein
VFLHVCALTSAKQAGEQDETLTDSQLRLALAGHRPGDTVT